MTPSGSSAANTGMVWGSFGKTCGICAVTGFAEIIVSFPVFRIWKIADVNL
ncbi:hypothetical protein V8F06_002509 [Rhypophila decipiens]